jgi:alkanesulfonate monooxygenase SsuD/methylene tetrahydromethanopterin reductase-like flavin-dependent oxidoreductase (luciferase family)/hemerythrin-like domain-containing protein
MPDYGHDLRFGAFLTPDAGNPSRVLELAHVCDTVGLDLVSAQDHPYQARHLDMWTLLAAIAAQTSSVRVAPNVANLALRPPVVLARSVATLDLLSNGRAELGIGSGAFWDAIVAVGGRRLRPAQAVDALREAIEVIRAMWDTSVRAVRHEGEYYRVVGAHPGPAPAHPVEIWIGAYKPRMLALTGAVADGWLPSMGYADPDALPPMNAAIDEAAEAAGRSPAAVRRLYNVNGRFDGGGGFLTGSARDWAGQLAELTLTHGISSYILGSDDANMLRRFAEEVAPAVRDLVASGRALGPALPPALRTAASAESPSAARRIAVDAGRFAVVPTPDDGLRLSAERPWDETSRPRGPAPDPARTYTAHEQAAGRHLIDVHDALRAELEQVRDVVAQVAEGALEADRARSLINTMAMRQNNWTLGAFCESYCRIVTGHHSLEDSSVFPHLRHRDGRLAPVLDRLAAEHEVIAEVLDRVDRALVALVTRPNGMGELIGAVDLLTDTMRSHLSYEERELVEPLARVGFY